MANFALTFGEVKIQPNSGGKRALTNTTDSEKFMVPELSECPDHRTGVHSLVQLFAYINACSIQLIFVPLPITSKIHIYGTADLGRRGEWKTTWCVISTPTPLSGCHFPTRVCLLLGNCQLCLHLMSDLDANK